VEVFKGSEREEVVMHEPPPIVAAPDQTEDLEISDPPPPLLDEQAHMEDLTEVLKEESQKEDFREEYLDIPPEKSDVIVHVTPPEPVQTEQKIVKQRAVEVFEGSEREEVVMREPPPVVAAPDETEDLEISEAPPPVLDEQAHAEDIDPVIKEESPDIPPEKSDAVIHVTPPEDVQQIRDEDTALEKIDSLETPDEEDTSDATEKETLKEVSMINPFDVPDKISTDTSEPSRQDFSPYKTASPSFEYKLIPPYKVAKVKEDEPYYVNKKPALDYETPIQEIAPSREERHPVVSVVKNDSPPAFGMPAAEALVRKDIRIEVSEENPLMGGIRIDLLRKRHPMSKAGRRSKKEQVVDAIKAISVHKRIFSVVNAEKGIYTFTIKNEGTNQHEVDIIFRLYEGDEKERVKNYSTVKLLPDDRLAFKFIIPETIFWDDDDYFSGSIEDSDYITKFNDETDFIWKEKRDN
jgi:hypothetical protein